MLTRVTHSRHPRPSLRRWSHFPDLRHPTGHRQEPDRLLPEVRRRALQEPPQAGPRPVRPNPPRCRQPSLRAQEVRWSRRPCQVPEVLPLNAHSPTYVWLFGGCVCWGFLETGGRKKAKRGKVLEGLFRSYAVSSWTERPGGKQPSQPNKKKYRVGFRNLVIGLCLCHPSFLFFEKKKLLLLCGLAESKRKGLFEWLFFIVRLTLALHGMPCWPVCTRNRARQMKY